MIWFRTFLAVAACALVGCTALYDYDVPAEAGCSTNADCPTAGQVCGSAGVCITPEPAPTALRVGYLFPGSVGDHGWVKSHDDGRKAVDELLGDDVTTTFVPNVFDSEDVEAAVPMLLEEGVNVIVGASSGHIAPLQRLAKDHPEVRFLLSAGFVSDANVSSYFGRMYQAKWLAGRLAGQMTQTNRVGYIGSFAIPQTVRHLNAFVEGVRSINPDAVVMVEWLNSFLDPDAEQLRSEQLLALDVDVLHGSTNAPSAVQAADGQTTPTDGLPVYSIGYNNPNICELFGPQSCIASAYWNWSPIVSRQLSQILDGAWDPTALTWDAIKANPEDSAVALTSPSTTHVSINIRLDVESFTARFAAGEIDAFDAVERDNTGGNRTINGDDDLLEMCWYVPGVVAPSAPPYMPAIVPNSCEGAR